MEGIKRKLVRAFNKRLLPCTTGAGACGIMQEALRPGRPAMVARLGAVEVEAVQTIAGNTAGFNSWFDALEHMEAEIAAKDFDVALIGCGAYGFPLAAFVKGLGRQAVHLGGVLQIYFGIKGKRWDGSGLYNEHWISPSSEERPRGLGKVEEGCYW